MASRHGVTYPPGLTCYPSARSVHICTLVETVQSGKTTTVLPVQDFDVRFGLTVYLDENGDGTPDVLPVIP